jgi:hypothetical protein
VRAAAQAARARASGAEAHSCAAVEGSEAALGRLAAAAEARRDAAARRAAAFREAAAAGEERQRAAVARYEEEAVRAAPPGRPLPPPVPPGFGLALPLAYHAARAHTLCLLALAASQCVPPRAPYREAEPGGVRSACVADPGVR